MKVILKCRYCGSTDIGRDAWATWDVDKQEWVHGDVYDDGWCNACDHEQKSFDEEEVCEDSRPADTPTASGRG